jgi:hypothetical protein
VIAAVAAIVLAGGTGVVGVVNEQKYCDHGRSMALLTVGNGDFGTSPIFGQLSGKPATRLHLICGVSDLKHNKG